MGEGQDGLEQSMNDWFVRSCLGWYRLTAFLRVHKIIFFRLLLPSRKSIRIFLSIPSVPGVTAYLVCVHPRFNRSLQWLPPRFTISTVRLQPTKMQSVFLPYASKHLDHPTVTSQAYTSSRCVRLSLWRHFLPLNGRRLILLKWQCHMKLILCKIERTKNGPFLAVTSLLLRPFTCTFSETGVLGLAWAVASLLWKLCSVFRSITPFASNLRNHNGSNALFALLGWWTNTLYLPATKSRESQSSLL